MKEVEAAKDEELEARKVYKDQVYSDRVKEILLAQPLNPLKKLEFGFLPRNHGNS
jgi:hypothetical protein